MLSSTLGVRSISERDEPTIMADPNKAAEFERRSRPISDNLINDLRRVVPPDWRIAMLQLDVSFSPATGMRSTKHRLWNPLTDAEVRDFPETLFQTTTALHAIFAEYQQAWTRCLVLYRLDPRGAVECEINYHYGLPT